MFRSFETPPVSIHASVKDATSISDFWKVATKVSIHASVKDATFGTIERIGETRVSIHASVKDATQIVFII